MTALRVLYVAYPLLTVSGASAGGAEQVLWTLEREMASSGVLTTVAASAGSCVSGRLAPTGIACLQVDDFERRNNEHQDWTVDFIRQRARQGEPFDLVHDMSGGFWARAAEISVPVLATLHLPRGFYAPHLFENIAQNVSFNCVSRSQAGRFANMASEVVPNGVALDLFKPQTLPRQRNGALWLGRICEEKSPHLAIEIAERAGLPLTIAGQVYPFSYHREYFEREIASRTEQRKVKLVNSPSIDVKRRLLRETKAVLITSQVDETSSLVAMEAAASGTPVVAFRRGALAEVIEDGVTGWLVDDVDGAVRALRRVAEIDSRLCIGYACRHFSSAAMAGHYFSLYGRILGARNPVPSLQDDKSSIPAV